MTGRLWTWTAYLEIVKKYTFFSPFRSAGIVYIFFQARVLSYLVPAMVASVILNIPKFLEARLEEVADLDNLSFLPIILKQTVLLVLLLSFLVRWKTDLRKRM